MKPNTTQKKFDEDEFIARMRRQHGDEWSGISAASMADAKQSAQDRNCRTEKYQKEKGREMYHHIIVPSCNYEGTRGYGDHSGVYSFRTKTVKIALTKYQEAKKLHRSSWGLLPNNALDRLLKAKFILEHELGETDSGLYSENERLIANYKRKLGIETPTPARKPAPAPNLPPALTAPPELTADVFGTGPMGLTPTPATKPKRKPPARTKRKQPAKLTAEEIFQLGREVANTISEVGGTVLKPTQTAIKNAAKDIGVTQAAARVAIEYYNWGHTYPDVPSVKRTTRKPAAKPKPTAVPKARKPKAKTPAAAQKLTATQREHLAIQGFVMVRRGGKYVKITG